MAKIKHHGVIDKRTGGHSMKTKTFLLFAGILLFSQLAPGAAAQECGPFVNGSGMNGDFVLGVSYYGAIGIINANQMRGDLDDFKERGLNNVRVWGNWTHWGALNSTIFDGNGTINNNALSRLVTLIQEADGKNMTADVTFSWRDFKNNQCGGGNCFDKFKEGVRASAAALRAC